VARTLKLARNPGRNARSSFQRSVQKKNAHAENSLRANKIDRKIQRNLVAKNESVIECNVRFSCATNLGP
jgi:hypothetical protein